jgi:hypothetical protein
MKKQRSLLKTKTSTGRYLKWFKLKTKAKGENMGPA